MRVKLNLMTQSSRSVSAMNSMYFLLADGKLVQTGEDMMSFLFYQII